jgi:hypothetical protein
MAMKKSCQTYCYCYVSKKEMSPMKGEKIALSQRQLQRFRVSPPVQDTSCASRERARTALKNVPHPWHTYQEKSTLLAQICHSMSRKKLSDPKHA